MPNLNVAGWWDQEDFYGPIRTYANLQDQTANHVFKKGHRIMVQVHNTWFPLYDRNPQKFVTNIFDASDSDYQKATQNIYRSKQYPSSVEISVLPQPRR